MNQTTSRRGISFAERFCIVAFVYAAAVLAIIAILVTVSGS